MTDNDLDLETIAAQAAAAARSRMGGDAPVSRKRDTKDDEVARQASEVPGAEVQVVDTETRRIELLGALAETVGDAGRAVKLLADRGVDTTRGELDILRERHAGVYAELAEQRARAAEDGLAQGYREIVSGGQRLTKKIIDQLNDDMERGVMPRDIERTLTAVTKAMQVGTDKLLTITGRPVAGNTGDPLEAIRELQRLGVARPVERPDDVVAEAEVVA